MEKFVERLKNGKNKFVAFICIMTRNEKIVKLLYFKGKFDNKHIMLNKLKSKENDDNFTIIVSIIKNGRQNNGWTW